ncbi:MAG: FkbM family methyltransferase [Parvibaculaceae bacterium]|nr:FkbM family methyltransferase [Parvibaculaceae bacterium]
MKSLVNLAKRLLDSKPDAALAITTAPSIAPEASFQIPKFWETSYWEPTVQMPIRDYVRPGDVVFDVGANAGALSMLMSRLVGPKGIVCSFEASPRIIDKTVYNLTTAGCSNAHVYYRAVYHTSNEIVTLYPGTHLNDSIYNDLGAEGGAKYEVETLALDDFIEATNLVPKLIKMDIEGAELDALKGMARLFEYSKPILILEGSPSDMRCHEYLTSKGYKAVDLANYRRIESARDFLPGTDIVNILYMDATKAEDDPYFSGSDMTEVARLDRAHFEQTGRGDIEIRSPVVLPAGRYLCKADFSANGSDNEIFAGIDTNNGVIHRYHTYTKFMAASYRDWVFTLRRDSQVKPYLRFLQGSDVSLDWRGATIYRLTSFDKVKPPIIF